MIYFDNPFRTLGLLPDVTQAGARTAMLSLRVRSRMAAEEAPDAAANDPLCSLAAVNRSEDAVRDAFNTLGAVGSRLEARLFWFTCVDERDTYALRYMAAGDFTGAIAAWNVTNDVAARANLARLYHALAIAASLYGAGGVRTVEHPWGEALRLWAGVAADERFWRELALADAAGGFEPAAHGEDIAALKGHLWSLLLAPSVMLIARRVGAGAFDTARAHLRELAVAGVAGAHLAALEREGWSSFQSNLEAALVEAHNAEPDAGEVTPRTITRAKYLAYRSLVVPYLVGITEQAGRDFEPTKRACETCASFLDELAGESMREGGYQLAGKLRAESAALRRGIIGREIRTTAGGNVATPRLAYYAGAVSVVAYVLYFVLVVGADVNKSRDRMVTRFAEPITLNRDHSDDDTGNDPEPTHHVVPFDSATLAHRSVAEKVWMTDVLIDRKCASIRAFAEQLKGTLAGFDRLDSLERRMAGRDSVGQRAVVERARGGWRGRVLDQWQHLEERFISCDSLLNARNRFVARNKQEAKRADLARKSMPADLVALYESLRNGIRRRGVFIDARSRAAVPRD